MLTVASAVALVLTAAPTAALVELSAQPSAVPHLLPYASVVAAAALAHLGSELNHLLALQTDHIQPHESGAG